MILFIAIGIFSLVALTLYYVEFTSKVYATGGSDSISNVPNMFNLRNMDCAIRSGNCDILDDKP